MEMQVLRAEILRSEIGFMQEEEKEVLEEQTERKTVLVEVVFLV
jgi:hypothetical protein